MTLILDEAHANSWVGAAHAPSPDVRYGPPVLHSLEGVCAPASMPALAAYAGSRGMGSPSSSPRSAEAVLGQAHAITAAGKPEA